MKNIALVLMVFLFLVSMISCDKSTGTVTLSSNDIVTTTTTETSSSNDITTTTTTETSGITQAEIDAVSTENITIEFDYYLPSSESDLLIEMIEAFESIYTNVDIVATRLSQVKDVTSNYINGVLGGDGSDLILTQQEYLAIVAGNIEPLDKFMNSVDIGVYLKMRRLYI